MALKAGRSAKLTTIGAEQVQSGSFVPAERAEVRLFAKLLTRLGSDDELESNASTFSLEMREASHILREADEDSLVLVDELGRGTSTVAGMALSTAISEALIASQATVVLVTHFVKMAQYLETSPSVKGLLFHLEMGQAPLAAGAVPVRQYTCEEGIASKASSTHRYGIETLQRLDFPKEVIQMAGEMLIKVGEGDCGGGVGRV